jgi:hypothetical protein
LRNFIVLPLIYRGIGCGRLSTGPAGGEQSRYLIGNPLQPCPLDSQLILSSGCIQQMHGSVFLENDSYCHFMPFLLG